MTASRWTMMIGGVAVLAAGCTTEARLPDLEAIYKRTSITTSEGPRRPLITVPGTLGSRLVDSDSKRVIWGGGGSAGISADPEDPEEYRLIALPVAKADEPLTELRDTVVPGGILETAQAEVLGIPIDVNVYGKALGVLTVGGFSVDRRSARLYTRAEREDGLDLQVELANAEAAKAPKAEAVSVPDEFNSFQYDYDWRRDLIESAHGLGRFLERKRQILSEKRGVRPESVKFDLLAHSMGTLVARYFLMYGFSSPGPDGKLPPITWEGAQFFDRVVLVAPPNAGSVIALDNLINDKELGPLQPVYPGALLSTHPAAYQLMPRARHNRVLIDGEPADNLFDVSLWERMGWGLAKPGIEDQLALLIPDEAEPERRRARALAYKARLLSRAETFHRMMDRWAPPPSHLDIFVVIGGGFETPAIAEVDGGTGEFKITTNEEGDGVVLRASALLDERMDGDNSSGYRSPLRFKTTLFLPDEHVELTQNRVFADNLLFWLLDAPRSTGELARPDNVDLLGNVSDGSAPEARREQGPQRFKPGQEN